MLNHWLGNFYRESIEIVDANRPTCIMTDLVRRPGPLLMPFRAPERLSGAPLFAMSRG
jgi:hypothetical protein